MTDKGLISKIYKWHVLFITRKKAVRKWAEDLNRHFKKTYSQSAGT